MIFLTPFVLIIKPAPSLPLIPYFLGCFVAPFSSFSIFAIFICCFLVTLLLSYTLVGKTGHKLAAFSEVVSGNPVTSNSPLPQPV